MDKPFWENTYKDDNITTFGTKPNRAVEAMWQTFDKRWSILDVDAEKGKILYFWLKKAMKISMLLIYLRLESKNYLKLQAIKILKLMPGFRI